MSSSAVFFFGFPLFLAGNGTGKRLARAEGNIGRAEPVAFEEQEAFGDAHFEILGRIHVEAAKRAKSAGRQPDRRKIFAG